MEVRKVTNYINLFFFLFFPFFPPKKIFLTIMTIKHILKNNNPKIYIGPSYRGPAKHMLENNYPKVYIGPSLRGFEGYDQRSIVPENTPFQKIFLTIMTIKHILGNNYSEIYVGLLPSWTSKVCARKYTLDTLYARKHTSENIYKTK